MITSSDLVRQTRSTMQARRRLLLAVIGALLLQFPSADFYYPAGRALWDLATGEVGDGPRSFWVAWAVAVIAAYTIVVYLVLTAMALLAKRVR